MSLSMGKQLISTYENLNFICTVTLLTNKTIDKRICIEKKKDNFNTCSCDPFWSEGRPDKMLFITISLTEM